MIIAITGNIASGKTEVLKILEKQDFFVIEADKIVHDLYRKGGAGQEVILRHFGKSFLKENGDVNREKLRELAFRNSDVLKGLNKLIHPLVYTKILKLIERNKDSDIAIESRYFDDSLLKLVDKQILLKRDEGEIKKVLMGERGFSEELADNVLGMKDDFKSKLVVENNSDLKDLEDRVIFLLS